MSDIGLHTCRHLTIFFLWDREIATSLKAPWTTSWILGQLEIESDSVSNNNKINSKEDVCEYKMYISREESLLIDVAIS